MRELELAQDNVLRYSYQF